MGHFFKKPIICHSFDDIKSESRLKLLFESKTPPVVIFPVSHAVGLSVIRTLEDYGIPLLALDFKRHSAGLYSRRVFPLLLPGLYDSTDSFVEGMLTLGSCFSERPVLFCVDDEDLFLSLKRRDEFEEYYRFPLSTWDIVKRIVDKGRFYKILEENHLPVPKTWHAKNIDKLHDCKKEIEFPCILKPIYSTAFRQQFNEKAKRFITFKELVNYAETVSRAGIEFIIQEYIPGDATRLLTYAAYSDDEGNVTASFTGRKVHQFPPDFGTCRLGESIKHPELEILGKKILKTFKYRGISLAEFKVDTKGTIKALEINPRPGDWPERLAQLCGANLVLAAYKDTIGHQIESQHINHFGLKWANVSEDFYYCVRGYRTLGYPDAHRGLWGWLKDLKGLATGAFFSWSDPAPGVIRTRGMLRDFWEREKEMRTRGR